MERERLIQYLVKEYKYNETYLEELETWEIEDIYNSVISLEER